MGRTRDDRDLEYDAAAGQIYANEGIAQVIFFEGDDECITSYADKKGKYQAQQTIVLPKV